MEDERVFVQLFGINCASMRGRRRTDDEVGQPAISVSGNALQIVRTFGLAGDAPRLQVVRASGDPRDALRATRRRPLPPSASFGERSPHPALPATGRRCP